MGCLFGYTLSMQKDATTPSLDRVRAAKALSEAIDQAMARNLFVNYVDIGIAMGFNRTNIAHHKSGFRPMSRKTVLKYAEVLQCDPEAIADDEVRMELARDLRRYESDQKDYIVIKECPGSNRTPIKLPREFVNTDDIDPNDLCTMRIPPSDIDGIEQVIIVWGNSRKPVNSGKKHVLIKNGVNVVAKIVEHDKGYIITQESDTGELAPTFRTHDEMISDGVVVAGQVFWRLHKE